MKNTFLICFFFLSAALLAQEYDHDALDIGNLMVMYRQGQPLPEGSVETNTIDVSFSVRNALKADRAKITVTQKSTGEILEVRTVTFSSRDGVAFFSAYGYPRRLHKDSVSVQIYIGNLTEKDVEVEVFVIDKGNVATRKLKSSD